MANVRDYHELLEKTVRLIVSSEEIYKAFLKTSAWNYKYSLPDRILIYAQKADAIACAEASVWEDPKMKRGLKKDAVGIGILREDSVSYLYDVADTFLLNRSQKPFYLWEYENEIEQKIVSLLKEVEPVALKTIEDLLGCITVLLERKLKNVEAYYMEDLYLLEDVPDVDRESYLSNVHRFIVSSVKYMVEERMGLLNSDSENIHYPEKDVLFSSEESFLIALAIMQAASEDLLRELGAVIKRLTPIPEKEKVHKEDYYEELWKIRSDEVGLSEGAETGQVHVLPDAGDIERASGGSGHESEKDGGGSSEGTIEILPGPQSKQHPRMDGTYEQLEANGGRSDVSNSDFQLKEKRLSAEMVDYILRYDHPGFKHTKKEIGAVLNDGSIGEDERRTYIKAAYGNTYYGLPHPQNNMTIGCCGQPEGLYMCEGDGNKVIADSLLSWEEVLTWHFDMTKNAQYKEMCEKRLSDKEMAFILSSDLYLTHTDAEISAVLLDKTVNFDAKKDFLISVYDEYYCSLLYPFDTEIEYVGYIKQDEGLYMWEGNFLTRTADSFVPWEDVLRYRMKELGITEIDMISNDAGGKIVNQNEPEVETVFVLKVKEDDVVYVAGKQYLVYEESAEKVVLQDAEFPLFLDEYSVESLSDVLKEDARNQGYYVPVRATEMKQDSSNLDETEGTDNQDVEIETEDVEEVEYGIRTELFDSSKAMDDLKNTEPVQYKIIPDAFVFGGAKERFRENMEAIKVLKSIEKDGRNATPKDQEMLFRYVGWGGLSSAFDKKDRSWNKEFESLKALLTEEEYVSARESTLTAFYTPPVIISGIYEILKNLGFENGNILDPACGTGNFFGMLPEEMQGSNLYGIELDDISGRIAKQLYQKSNIAITGFEKTNLPNQFFDVVIGNVPFGQFSVSDDTYKNQNFMIHDYFFAKALDKVRPGGIVAFITSKGTMDKKSSEVREYIAVRADLLGAIRLPNDTFTKNAGTTVTSDILILQKRDRMRTDLPYWTEVGETSDGFTLNQYFIEHPEMVLGKLSMEKGQAGRLDLACVPDYSISFEERIREAISHINGEYQPFDFDMEEMDEKLENSIPADISIQNFGYTLIGDEVYQRRDSRMYPVEANATALRRIKGLIPIRETLRQLIQTQLDNGSDVQISALQKRLNELYDGFVEEFDRINSRGNSIAFSDDSSYYLLCSLEVLDEDEHFVRKADIFTKRTVRVKEKSLQAEDSKDALAVSMGELGRIDLEFMESLLSGKTKADIISDLTGVIFRNPLNEDEYLTADEYLSGNVKEKLQVAKEKANENPSYRVNVEALLAVQPKPLEATDISVRLGSTWIPDDVVTEFYWDLFDVDKRYRDPDSYNYMHVSYTPLSDAWVVEGSDWGLSNVLLTSTYGTKRRSGKQIFEDVLNLKESKVIDYYEEDGKKKSRVNRAETILAQEKQERIKEAFADWIWKDMDRRERLVSLYNDTFNSMRPREYNGDYLLFHGMNPEITLQRHQVDAVARGIYGGNTLLDHPVGAGKTYEMVAIAMEGKRLGLCNKNLFVVPNHLLKQWASDFLTLYPAANVLVATEKDFTPANRKKFCARIATGNFDAVIIGHSQFEKIPLSEERQEQYLTDQIMEISSEIDRLMSEKGNHLTVKALERTKKSLENNLNKFHDKERRDDVITFEELGVDRLFIDEFHFYKNLWFYTKMQNIAGVSPTGAQKTSDLFMKVQYLNELTEYKGLVGATGTPITNSLAEFYSLMRYFVPQTLDRLGLTSFDAWASTFAEVVTSVELAPEGTNYRTKQRLAKFYNIPELIMLYHEFADVKTPDMLKLPVPEAVYENICVPASNEQLDILKELSKRADVVRDGGVDPTEDNMLKITNDGRKLALEQRLVDDTLPDNPNSKVNACVEKVYNIWKEKKAERLTQLLFCDLSTPKRVGKKKDANDTSEKELDRVFDSVYEDVKRKLIEKGVPEEEIAFIHDANTTKQKEKLFSNVRRGKVRILMGSSSKMGVGTNVQDLVYALHHLDCPWRPSDMEQEDGRGIRQGNKNPVVNIYNYVTENTFDAYSYQLLEQKQRFISQVRNGSLNVRSADDIDDSTLAFAEIKALVAGNPLIKEKMDLDIQVHKLNLLKTEYQKNQYQLQENVAKRYPARIADYKAKIRDMERDIETYRQHIGAPFSITLDGKRYQDASKAGKALENIISNVKPYEKNVFGKYAGFELSVYYSDLSKEHTITVSGKGNYRLFVFKTGTKNLAEIIKTLETLPETLQGVRRDLEQTEKDLLKAEVELEKEFAYADELDSKNKRLTELNILLNVEGGAGKEELLKSAKDPETAAELLHQLASHDETEIREAVAANPTTALEDLLSLKKDVDEKVLLSAYSNPNMPKEEVFAFCKEASESMLSGLLDGPHVTKELLSVVLKNLDPHSNLAYKFVKHKKATPEHLDALAKKGNKYLYSEILKRQDILPETVEFIATSCEGDWWESKPIAEHPLCSEERMLSYCEKLTLQEYVLKNPCVTKKVLEHLAESGGYLIKKEAQKKLAERIQEEKCREKSLDEKMKSINAGIHTKRLEKVFEKTSR